VEPCYPGSVPVMSWAKVLKHFSISLSAEAGRHETSPLIVHVSEIKDQDQTQNVCLLMGACPQLGCARGLDAPQPAREETPKHTHAPGNKARPEGACGTGHHFVCEGWVVEAGSDDVCRFVGVAGTQEVMHEEGLAKVLSVHVDPHGGMGGRVEDRSGVEVDFFALAPDMDVEPPGISGDEDLVLVPSAADGAEAVVGWDAGALAWGEDVLVAGDGPFPRSGANDGEGMGMWGARQPEAVQARRNHPPVLLWHGEAHDHPGVGRELHVGSKGAQGAKG
jgi:hypothetical protein